MESISKSGIQGVWDSAHSTRTGIITHSTRVGIPSSCRHFPPGCLTFGILLPPPFHPDVSHPEFYCRRHSIRMSHIRNSAAAAIPSGCLTSEILTPDRRGEYLNFPGQTYPDHLIALTRRVSQPFCTVPRCLLKLPDMSDRYFEIFFCTVPRCSLKASKYLRPTFWDILL